MGIADAVFEVRINGLKNVNLNEETIRNGTKVFGNSDLWFPKTVA